VVRAEAPWVEVEEDQAGWGAPSEVAIDRRPLVFSVFIDQDLAFLERERRRLISQNYFSE
jgi:hypothetical protein